MTASSLSAQRAATTEDELVDRLGHDDYHTRLAVRHQIHDIGPTDLMLQALNRGTKSDFVEIRLSSKRLLQQFELDEFDSQISRLLNLRVDATQITLPGWKRYAQLVGDDFAARKVFAKIAAHHFRHLRSLERLTQGSYSKKTTPSSLLELDPYRLTRSDALTWSLLLFYDCAKPKANRTELSSRILNALVHSGLCPSPDRAEDKAVLNRLVAQWLKTHHAIGDTRDRLIVSMRYDCQTAARETCDRVMSAPAASPSSLATAMLAASSLELDGIQQRLVARVDDSRTSHVWQLIASRKTRIRTQVRDVAVALLLHDRGLDPRDFGFIEIQADPLLTYRDHSLGFADNESRKRAHAVARERLGL